MKLWTASVAMATLALVIPFETATARGCLSAGSEAQIPQLGGDEGVVGWPPDVDCRGAHFSTNRDAVFAAKLEPEQSPDDGNDDAQPGPDQKSQADLVEDKGNSNSSNIDFDPSLEPKP
jgi:hypothetical protein